MRERHRREGSSTRFFHKSARLPEGDDPNFTPRHPETISAPTLIVFGDRDPLYPISIAVRVVSGDSRASLWVVPNGGHGPVFGSHAARFVETALSFLSGRL